MGCLEWLNVLDYPIQTDRVCPGNSNRLGHSDSSGVLVVVLIIAQIILLEIVEILVLLVGHSEHIIV